MSSHPTTKRNPYKGARAFEIGETIFGRDREIAELLDLLIAERIVLLHSPSGAGKTSLVQAGLVPALKKARFEVLPIIRVNHEPPADVKPSDDQKFNRYVYSALLSLEEARPAAERFAEVDLRATTLPAYLERRASQRVPSRVLIFDQFEEILTSNATDIAAKEAFFNQVGTALSNRRCWALFAMREDYVGALSPYLRWIPSRFTTTYRLDLLGITAAELAIQKPAEAEGVEFHDDATERLIDDLRILRVQGQDGGLRDEKGVFVEPVQLQVVCYRLWDRLHEKREASVLEIRVEDIETGEDVNHALAGYYAQSVSTVAEKEHVSERRIREWFTDSLITAQGLRGQVMSTGKISQGLEDAAIWELVNVYLVRAEKRRNAVWFELAHDRLIEPVQENNAQWFATHLNEFQRQAALWASRHQPESLLLHDAGLVKAENWANDCGEELTAIERAFLERSLEARTESEQESLRLREQAVRDRKQIRKIKTLAVVLGILFLVAGGISVTAAYIARRLSQTTRISRSQELNLKATSALNDNPDLALLLSVEAYETEATIEARIALLNALDNSSHIEAFLHGHDEPIRRIALSPDGKTLASAGATAIKLWDADNHTLISTLFSELNDISALTFNHNGQLLVAGYADGTFITWDIASGNQLVRRKLDPHEWVRRYGLDIVAGKHNDEMVIQAREGLSLWNLRTGEKLGIYQNAKTASGRVVGRIDGFAFTSQSEKLTGYTDHSNFIIWESLGKQPQVKEFVYDDIEDAGGYDLPAAFNFDGRFAAVSTLGGVRVYDTTATKLSVKKISGSDSEVTALAFSRSGDQIAIGESSGKVRIVNNEFVRSRNVLYQGTVAPEYTARAGHNRGVSFLVFGPEIGELFSGGGDAKIIIWQADDSRLAASIAQGKKLIDAIFNDSGQLITCDEEGKIETWDNDGKLIATVHNDPSVGWHALTNSNGKLMAAGIDLPKFRERTEKTTEVSVSLWNGNEKRTLTAQTLENATSPILSLSHDGRMLAVSTDRGPITIWDTNTLSQRGQPLLLQVNPEPGSDGADLRFLVFNHAKTRLVGNGSSDIALWDLTTSERLQSFITSIKEAPATVAFSHDDMMFAAAFQDRIVIWDMDIGAEIGSLKFYREEFAGGLAFSPDNKILAVNTTWEGTLLFDVETGQRLGPPLKARDTVCKSVFSVDGKRLLVLSCSGSGGMLWHLDPQAWVKLARKIANRQLTAEELK